jgi:hypothetical protein
MVFRAESEFDLIAAYGCGDGASDGWAGDVEMEILSSFELFALGF